MIPSHPNETARFDGPGVHSGDRGALQRRARRIRITRAVFAVVLLAGGLYVGSCGIEPVPPVGGLLDPVNGIWAVAREARLPAAGASEIAGLGDSVVVSYDSRAVPHIWATTVEDAVLALGYVVARDRLFQLELQTRATAGRLTELVGPVALEEDRRQRSLGLAWSAEREFAGIDSASVTMRLLQAYAAGVNARIAELRAGDVPFEFHVLGARPQRWEPIHSLYLVKRMGYTLAFSDHDRLRQELDRAIGERATDALFPLNSPIQEPLQPNGRDEPRFDFDPLPQPELAPAELDTAASRAKRQSAGSNNWVVAPARTANGHALLAGDPHLGLTLPSIWYEVHLVVPGELDVYGVTIPGIPGIVIGFNRDVAWSFTNAQVDVLDYYREVVDDPTRPTEYHVNGEWMPLEQRIEPYHGKHGDLLAVDTVRFSHRGPLVRSDHSWLSLRWTVLEETGAIGAFYGADRAHSVTEWLAAMEGFYAPPQNAVVADREGNIAIRSVGHFPIRPGDGNGTKIRVGVTRANDWRGYLPVSRYPYSLNPAQGYLASANQQPVDPSVDDSYLGVNWISPWRAMRINRLLRADSQVTPDAMRRYQTDPGSTRADLFVPALLRAAERTPELEPDRGVARAARILGGWDRRYTKDDETAILFETVMAELTDLTWDELEDVPGHRIATPAEAVLAELLEDPESWWWDVRSTKPEIETRDDVLAAALRRGLQRTEREHGPRDDGGWRWDAVRNANVYHLLGVPALSALDLPVQGGPGTLNPSAGEGGFGASWRMVVELGPTVQAWSTYPGGQSGNPASPYYDDRIPQWVEGGLDAVLLPHRPEDLGDAVAGKMRLLPDRRSR